ncbi:acyltransferase domain-containing protein [Actinosynnema sp. CA-248983]
MTGVVLREYGATGRLGVVNPTPERLQRAEKVARKGRPWRGRDDIWFSPEPLHGKVVFLFPGLEAEFKPRVEDLVDHPLDLGTDTVGRHAAAVLATGRVVDEALRRTGIRPDAVAGHSVGEWSAMVSGGLFDTTELQELLWRTDLDALRVPGVEFAVLGCPLTKTELHWPNVVVSHENSANQTVVCGPADEIAELAEHYRRKAVICQVLPFRSGFHTPVLEPYLEQFHIPKLPLHPAHTQVWSATTARPFPTAEPAIRDLCRRHLLEPVRFATLLRNLHDAGFRAFVQAGPGTLTSLVSDTLRDRDHLAVAANSPHRSGIEQLRRVATALWVEGHHPDFSALDPAPEPRGALAEFQAVLKEAEAAVAAVLDAQQKIEVSTAAMPHLLDHCFAHQRPGWPDESDLRPVMPATTMIAHLVDAAGRAAPGRVVTDLRDVRFHRWLVAAPGHRVPLSARDGRAKLGDYADAAVTTAQRHQPAPRPWDIPHDEHEPVLPAHRLYDERWLFHGPSYRGLTRTVAIGERSVRGRITVPGAPGALLDNVGQLLGHWLVERHPARWIAFPKSIDHIRWHTAEPPIGSTVDCAIRVTELTEDTVRADAQVIRDGELVVAVTGWTDHRFDGGAEGGAVHRFPETSTLSRPTADGWWQVVDRWSLASREFYLHKYCGAAERAEYSQCPPTHRRDWLAARVAVKDAVRGALWQDGAPPLFPAEVRVRQHGDRFTAHGLHGLALPPVEVTVLRSAAGAVAWSACAKLVQQQGKDIA